MTDGPLILAVDDEPDLLSLNRIILEKEGYRVVTSGDGVDAIRKAADLSPDLIILDVMMPRMNGYQVCRLLKNDPRTAGIPIIMNTVKSLETDKLYAFTSGADHYLVKPSNAAELLEAIKKCFSKKPPETRSRRYEKLRQSQTSTDSILSDVNRLLDRRLMELTVLHHVTRAMTTTLDLDGVLETIRKNIVHDLGYPGGMIFLLSEDCILEERIKDSDPLRIDTTRHPVFSRALAEDKVVTLATEELTQEAPKEFRNRIRSSLAILVPIRAKGHPIGLLVVDSPYPYTIDRDQREFLLTLASQAGLVIENANLYAKTLQLSITDGLTELYNYRYFCDRLEKELAGAKRYSKLLGLFIIDIDRFKSFNDNYGHLLGDAVLKTVAQILKDNTRDVDIVARYGGEEFAIILQEIGADEVQVYAERIREAVEASKIKGPGEAPLGVTVSLGVAVCNNGELKVREFILLADQALYRAKELGRNRVCLS